MLNTEKNNRLTRLYEQTMKEIGDFFKINWTRNRPKVFLVPDRKTIDSLRETKTPRWLVGWAGAKSEGIYILDSRNFEKESENSYSIEKWEALLKHELIHCFYGIATDMQRKPVWLCEGASTYLSGQNKWKKPIKIFEKILDSYDMHDKSAYYEGGFAVQFLIEKYGKDKLLELLNKIKKEKPNKQDFAKLFQSVYGFKLSYTNLNKLL